MGQRTAPGLLHTPLGVQEVFSYGQLGPKCSQLPWLDTNNGVNSLSYGVWVLWSKQSVISMAQYFWYSREMEKESFWFHMKS